MSYTLMLSPSVGAKLMARFMCESADGLGYSDTALWPENSPWMTAEYSNCVSRSTDLSL